MAIYVDNLYKQPDGTLWCHMMSDMSLAELNKFGSELKLKHTWLQLSREGYYHYDLTCSMRQKAIAYGANPVSSTEMMSICGDAMLSRWK